MAQLVTYNSSLELWANTF